MKKKNLETLQEAITTIRIDMRKIRLDMRKETEQELDKRLYELWVLAYELNENKLDYK